MDDISTEMIEAGARALLPHVTSLDYKQLKALMPKVWRAMHRVHTFQRTKQP